MKSFDLIDRAGDLAGSLPIRGAWIEIFDDHRRTPLQWSLPIRGAWIEIGSPKGMRAMTRTSLPIRGAWIEMVLFLGGNEQSTSRSPSGERGLKLKPDTVIISS